MNIKALLKSILVTILLVGLCILMILSTQITLIFLAVFALGFAIWGFYDIFKESEE